MNWKNKIDTLKVLFTERPELVMHFEFAPPAPTQFVEQISTDYAHVPASYLEFLRHSDGIRFDWFVLFGSGESKFQRIYALVERLKLRIGDKRVLPIGENAGGDAFVLTESTVELLPHPKYGGPKVLTIDFDELLNDFFLGAKFPLLFDGQPSVDDPWFALLRDLGWA